MLIGAGGLQAQVMFELDQVRREGMIRSGQANDTIPAQDRNIPEGERLIRLVEQLNIAAALTDYPFRFRTKRAKDQVKIYRYPEKEPEAEEELTPEDLAEECAKAQEMLRRYKERHQGHIDQRV